MPITISFSITELINGEIEFTIEGEKSGKNVTEAEAALANEFKDELINQLEIKQQKQKNKEPKYAN